MGAAPGDSHRIGMEKRQAGVPAVVRSELEQQFPHGQADLDPGTVVLIGSLGQAGGTGSKYKGKGVMGVDGVGGCRICSRSSRHDLLQVLVPS